MVNVCVMMCAVLVWLGSMENFLFGINANHWMTLNRFLFPFRVHGANIWRSDNNRINSVIYDWVSWFSAHISLVSGAAVATAAVVNSTVVRRPHFFRARWATLFLFSHWLMWLLFTLKIKIIIESHNWIKFDQRTTKQKQEKKNIISKKDFNLKRFRLIDLRQLISVTANKVNSRRSHNIYQFPNWESLLQRRFIVKTNAIINSGRKTHPNWYAESLIELLLA